MTERPAGRRPFRGLPRVARAAALAVLALAAACRGGGEAEGKPLRFTVPPGAGLAAVADTLEARGIVDSGWRFRWYASRQNADRQLKPGIYEVRRGEDWAVIVRKLVTGDVVKIRIVIPEGWEVDRIADRVAAATGLPRDTVIALMADPRVPGRLGVPGPTMEGYLYPATYVFPLGTPLNKIVGAMAERYRGAWTPALRARADSLGMSEREVVALASIVEKEARVWAERPRISAVYHNRLKKGMRLQADPTVQYALGKHQSRLLYSDIREVADNPYNTYHHKGLPPGPIASPSRAAIEAALYPEANDYLFFVARPNGTHIFTRTLAEHNAAKRASRTEARTASAAPAGGR